MPTTPSHRGWSRRQFIGTTAAAAGASLTPGLARAQGGPWAQRPPGNPRSVTFVVWQYGKIYEQIAKQFEQDWSVKVNQIIEPNVEPQVAKLTAMYAAGDTVDVSQSPMQYLASYIDQGIATPIDGLPGVDQYVKDFTPFTRAIAQRDGKTWGLAVLLHGVGLHLQRRAARQGRLQGQAVLELSRAARAGAQGQEGRRVASTRSSGWRARASSSCPRPGSA